MRICERDNSDEKNLQFFSLECMNVEQGTTICLVSFSSFQLCRFFIIHFLLGWFVGWNARKNITTETIHSHLRSWVHIVIDTKYLRKEIYFPFLRWIFLGTCCISSTRRNGIGYSGLCCFSSCLNLSASHSFDIIYSYTSNFILLFLFQKTIGTDQINIIFWRLKITLCLRLSFLLASLS